MICSTADHIGRHGASFFDELVEGTGLLRTQVEEALAELVAFGLVAWRMLPARASVAFSVKTD